VTEQNISMQQLKEQRMTPAEKFVLETIKGVKANEPDEDGVVWWYKNGKCLFKQDFKNGFLDTEYDTFNSKLICEYGLDYNESYRLLTRTLYKYTNNGQLKVGLFFDEN